MELNKSKVRDIRKKSDFVLDVLEKEPNWIVTWGNLFFLIFLLLLFLISGMIRYPDILRARTILTLKKPPISVLAEGHGEIDSVFYKDKDTVSKGDIILKIHSSAELEDIIILKRKISFFDSVSEVTDYIKHSLPENLTTGEVSEKYNSLIKEYKDFQFFIQQDIVLKQVNLLNQEILRLQELNLSLKKQQDLFSKQFGLSKKNHERNVKLHKLGVISDRDKEKSESSYLDENRQLENYKISQINNKIRIQNIKSQINNILSSREQELATWKNRVNEKVDLLRNEIELWEKFYIVEAPVDGILSIENKIRNQFHVKHEDQLFNIIPKGKNEIVGLLEMPTINSAEININSKVKIQLDAYPYESYGMIEGNIDDISLLPKPSNDSGNTIQAKLKINQPLVTTFNKKISFKPNMVGDVLIIKEDKTLLERIFDKFKSTSH